jgi:hypothetical protein
MIERTVFLREDDDVLNILNCAGAIACRYRKRLRNICFQRRQAEARGARQLQELATINRHEIVLASKFRLRMRCD